MATERMKRSERIEQILDSTLELVGEKPLAAIRTAEIAARAGITEGAMYKYFSSKDEIIEGIRRRYLAINHPLKKPEEIHTPAEFKAFIHTYLDSMITCNASRRAYLRLLLQISMEKQVFSFEKYSKIMGGFWATMENRIEFGKQHWGFCQDFNTPVQVRLFHFSLLMFLIEQEVFEAKKIDPYDLKAVKEVVVNNFFKLLKG